MICLLQRNNLLSLLKHHFSYSYKLYSPHTTTHTPAEITLVCTRLLLCRTCCIFLTVTACSPSDFQFITLLSFSHLQSSLNDYFTPCYYICNCNTAFTKIPLAQSYVLHLNSALYPFKSIILAFLSV